MHNLLCFNKSNRPNDENKLIFKPIVSIGLVEEQQKRCYPYISREDTVDYMVWIDWADHARILMLQYW